MAKILAVGVYMADRPNTAGHVIDRLSASAQHTVLQRWIALAPGGRGAFNLPATQMIVTEPAPKFSLLDQITRDASEFDWLMLCDDDVEVEPDFIDRFIGVAEKYDFALSQPARTADSFTDHPIVQVIPGVEARRTRFVEIGPIVCLRRDAVPVLLPFGEGCGMGWGLDFVWPVRIESAGLRMGIVDAAPVAHRLREPVTTYVHGDANSGMCRVLASHSHLTLDDAFTVLEAYA